MSTRSRSNENRVAREILFAVFTIVLILVCTFFVSGTVVSQSKGTLRVDEEYYQELEESYVREIRDCLNDQGFCNSGVTLTKTVEATGERNYEVLIHHKRLSRLTGEEQAELFSEIEEMGFDLAGCNFQVNLLL